MTFLIDGYNLLHAIGWAPLDGRLRPARTRLLDWLAESWPHKQDAASFRVLFDAQAGRAGASEVNHRGILVSFALGGTADDLIEELLAADPRPGELNVITNDQRLHESARRAGARAWPCVTFLDWLAEPETIINEPAPKLSEKPEGPTPATEVAELLRAFQTPKTKAD